MKTVIGILLLFALHSSVKAFPQDTIYRYVDTMPGFKGGEAALLRYISMNVEYPQIHREDDISLTALIRFVVNTDGTTSDFKVIKSIHPSFDNQLIKAIKNAGKFTPGIKDGKPVRVYFNFPIHINLK